MNILTTLVFILLQYLYDGETCTDFVPLKDENREGITPAPGNDYYTIILNIITGESDRL